MRLLEQGRGKPESSQVQATPRQVRVSPLYAVFLGVMLIGGIYFIQRGDSSIVVGMILLAGFGSILVLVSTAALIEYLIPILVRRWIIRRGR